MATPTTPAARLQVIALHEAKCTYEQISTQLGIHRQTVSSIIRKHDIERKAKDASAIATRDDILRRMTKLMYDADRPGDSIAAAKLIALMMGWLVAQNTSDNAININVLSGSVDIKGLEREYQALSAQALESPTTQSNAQVDTTLSPTRSDELVGHPSASEANQEREGDP